MAGNPNYPVKFLKEIEILCPEQKAKLQEGKNWNGLKLGYLPK